MKFHKYFIFIVLLSILIEGCKKKNEEEKNPYIEFRSFLGEIVYHCKEYKVELKDIHTGESKIKPVLKVEELKKYFPEPKRIREHKERIYIQGKREYYTVSSWRYTYDGFNYRIVDFKDFKNYALLDLLDLRKVQVPIYFKGEEISKMKLNDYLKRLSIEMSLKKDTFCISVFSYDYLYGLREPYSYYIITNLHLKDNYWYPFQLIFERQKLTIIEGGPIEIIDE